MTRLEADQIEQAAVDLLSDKEKAPKHDPRPTVVHEATANCPECGASFRGTMRNAHLGMHRRHKHGIAGSSTSTKKKVPAKKAAKAAKAPLTERVRTPLPEGKRRKPASDIIRRLFMTGSKVVAVMPGQEPVAACLAFESAAAGAAIDKAVVGSFIDRLVIQKLAGASERWEGLSSVVALPVCVVLVTRYPSLFATLEDDMREAVEDILITSLPTLQRKAERQRKAVGALSELMKVSPELANSQDPIGEVMRGFLPAYVFDPSLLHDEPDA